jgi:hypothetical protein
MQACRQHLPLANDRQQRKHRKGPYVEMTFAMANHDADGNDRDGAAE